MKLKQLTCNAFLEDLGGKMGNKLNGQKLKKEKKKTRKKKAEESSFDIIKCK